MSSMPGFRSSCSSSPRSSASRFIRLFQIPVYLEGNVIDLGVYKLQVVEACSGLRYLYPLMSLGFLAAYLFQAPLWQRALVFLSTIPITIAMNSLRIGLVGVMVDHFGPQDADGFLHMFEGWIIFIACALLLVAEMYVLARFVSGKKFLRRLLPAQIAGRTGALGRLTARSHAVRRCSRALCFCAATAVAGAFVSARQEISSRAKGICIVPGHFGRMARRASRRSTRKPNTSLA